MSSDRVGEVMSSLQKAPRKKGVLLISRGVASAQVAVVSALTARGYVVRSGYLHGDCEQALGAFNNSPREVAFVLILFPMLVQPETLRALRGRFPDIPVVTYNWDEPYAWTERCRGSNRLVERAPFVDVALSCSREALAYHTAAGTPVARHANPYTRTHDVVPSESVLREDDLRCDVVFCCTNLYSSEEHYPDQVVNRRVLLETLGACCQANGLTFHLYAPPSYITAESLPAGLTHMKYVQQDGVADRAALARARVCLNTHVVASDGYLNERTGIALSAGAVMLVDAQPGVEDFLTPGVDCVMYTSAEEACAHVLRLCATEAADERCAIRRQAVRTAERHFSGAAFVAVVEAGVAEHATLVGRTDEAGGGANCPEG